MFQAALDFVTGSYGVSNIDYLPLLKDCQEIRLLELRSQNTANLLYVPIDAAPTFVALSYTWGDPRPVAPFYVDGKKILLPRSLSKALSRAFPKYYSINIWADAICINQKDDVEKANQVAMMSSIYKKASKVVVYLGQNQIDNGMSPSYGPSCKTWATGGLTGADKVPDLRVNKDLASFLEHPWWNRIWTLQEILFASRASFCWGEDGIQWEDIQKVSFSLQDIEGNASSKGHDAAIAAAKAFQGGFSAKVILARRIHPALPWHPFVGDKSWFVMMAATTRFESTDPRDRLYALVALCKELPGFEISYIKPADEVFRDFTTRYLRASENLELLQLCGVNIPMGRTLPSWVPNYENLKHAILNYGHKLQSAHWDEHIKNEFKVWDACNSLPRKLHPPSSANIIRPEGIKVDTILDVNELNKNWLSFAYKHLGVDYNPPTMKCHILQAYFRTVLGDRNERTNSQLTKCTSRFDLAGTFWHITRKSRDNVIQQMNISGPIEKILLGETNHRKHFKVQLGSEYARMSMTLTDNGQFLHLFVTADGYLGYGPQCQKDDVVCVLFGCSVPLILRRLEQGGWMIVGQCFVLGIMNGELCRDLVEQHDQTKGETLLRKVTEVFDIH